jgi:AhpD family alkylhydroperoxidase
MTRLLLPGVIVLSATLAWAQAPHFFKETYPKHALESALEARRALQGEKAELDAKTRELISLGVAAQIPCDYCIYVHTKNARASGASDAEIREAVAAAASVRHWSTVLNGMDYDFEKFKAEVDKMGDNVAQSSMTK